MTIPSEDNIALFEQTAGNSSMIRFEASLPDVEEDSHGEVEQDPEGGDVAEGTFDWCL